MPINLTTDFNPGDVDPGQSYTHVEIYRMTWIMNEHIELYCRYGYLDEGTFIPGKLPDRIVHIRNKPRMNEYPLNDLLAEMPLVLDHLGAPIALEDLRYDGDPVTIFSIYENVGNGLYQYLINSGWFPGTVE